jgi:hypothetical protein
VQFNRSAPSLGFLAAAVMLGVITPAGAGAAVIDFEDQPHGAVIDQQYRTSHGLQIEGHNWRGGPDLAIIFDTTQLATADPDLEDPFAVGNLSLATLGRALVIAENDVDADGDALIDSPDDQASPVGRGSSGEIVFRFDAMQTSFGFDLLDVDGAGEIDAMVGYVSFRRWGVEKARVSLAELLNPTSTFYDPTITFGDHSANRIAPFTAAELGIEGFNGVAINLASGAIDNVTFGDTAPIPEPSAIALLAPCAYAVVRRRRRA